MKKLRIIFAIIFLVSIIGITYSITKNSDKSKKELENDVKVIEIMENLIPEKSLGISGDSIHEPVLEIDKESYIGYFEFPSLNLKYPILKNTSRNRPYAMSYQKSPYINVSKYIHAENDYGRIELLKNLSEYEEAYFKDVRGQITKYLVSGAYTRKIDDDTKGDLIINIKSLTKEINMVLILDN